MKVNLITIQSGFPFGTANAKRINLLGKAIIASGNSFRVFTNSIEFNKFNSMLKGDHEGIPFEYLHQRQIKSGLSKSLKISYFFTGIFRLIGILKNLDKNNDVVYSYNHGTLFNYYLIVLCKFFRLKLIQEINEWYHNDLNRKLERYIVEGPLVKKSDAAVVISETIERRVLEINPNLKVLQIPVLEDFSKSTLKYETVGSTTKYCFWMGDVIGYLHDVLFITKALGEVYKTGVSLEFFISGPSNDESLSQVVETAIQFGFPAENIKLLGYLDEVELNRYCRDAYFFVVPLWDDERSKSRFPTKIASFMQAGKPVISCRLGEISNLLTDRENILFYKEGNYIDLADKIGELVEDKDLYDKISTNSSQFAIEKFNYMSYKNELKKLIESL
jgi:glycosyltransferase involved in cell wall biosynthesis